MITSRPRTTKIVNDKILKFIDKQAKDKEWVPPPNKYPMIVDWKNLPDFRKKGYFSKLPRTTFTESILKNPRLKEWPGPATYKRPFGIFEGQKMKKSPDNIPDKECAFIGEAQFRSTQSPSPGHNNISFVSYRKLMFRPTSTRIRQS